MDAIGTPPHFGSCKLDLIAVIGSCYVPEFATSVAGKGYPMRLAVPAAIAVMLGGSGWSAPAMASDWGCQVLLCLSNPGGPTQYAACVPPITKLWEALATGHPFPTCIEGGVSGTKTHGKRGSSSYRVTMTYTDGSQQSYSLAGISNAPSIGEGNSRQGGADQP